MRFSLKFTFCIHFSGPGIHIFTLKPEPEPFNSPRTELKEECHLSENKRFHDKL